MINTHYIKRDAERKEMPRFELDRLFGLALTDARFFERLREDPCQAVGAFDLTEPEAQAISRIAPGARSVQDLALELDAWMTAREWQQPAPVHARRQPGAIPAARPDPLRPRFDSGGQRSYVATLPVTVQEDEQRLCLTMREPISQN